MLMDRSPAVKLHALRCLHSSPLSDAIFSREQLQRLVRLLRSADAHMQVSVGRTL